MPIPLQALNIANVPPATFSQIKANYQYPMKLRLKPGDPLHEKLRSEILSRAVMSHDIMSRRYYSWQQIDKMLTTYMPVSEKESARKDKDETEPIAIVVPVMYAALDVLLTYMVAAFLDDPIFRYTGVGDEDVLGATLLERCVSVQAMRSRMGLNLYTSFRDSFAYGFGAATPTWDIRYGYRYSQPGALSRLGAMFGYAQPQTERYVAFEGNKLQNIDPYKYFPDTNFPVNQPQDAEFVSWLHTESHSSMLAREVVDTDYFNGVYLQAIDGRSTLSIDESGRDRDKLIEGFGTVTSKSIDVLYMYINIIPEQWGVGRKTYPELWQFGLAGDQVIVCCKPVQLFHGMKPISVNAPDFDGYSIAPLARLETVYGLQEMTNFYYNSHMLNVRKAINDMFVVDPMMINIPDLRTAGPGKIIRTRKKAWGQSVEQGIKQLDVRDVTANHVGDASMAINLLDLGVGSADVLKGIQRKTSERVSATEYSGTRTAALSRLEKVARISSLQMVSDLAYMIAAQTQQFMTEDTYVTIAGEYEQQLREEYGDVKRVLVGPANINVSYDVIPHDGTLPDAGDSLAWKEMFQVLATNPYLAQQFDMVRIFKHWARISGAKNLNSFVLRGVAPQVLPPEKIEKQVQAGNIVPTGGG